MRVVASSELCCRRVTLGDLPECLRLHPAKMGAERIGVARALRAWERIFQDEDACTSALVERPSASVREVVGFGIAVFVTRAFADAEVAHPQPGLNARIIESVDAGRSVIPSYRYLQEANARGVLQQVVLYTSWKHERLSLAETNEVRSLLARAYLEVHAGYRLERMLCELVDEHDFWHVRDYRGVAVISRFEEFCAAHPDSPWNVPRGLAQATAQTLAADPGSVAASPYLNHVRPRFGFSRGEKKLLEKALWGCDDQELAYLLRRSAPALKRRWSGIFQKVARQRPDICPPAQGDIRGPQKRYRVLAYVRSHPEELRPFRE